MNFETYLLRGDVLRRPPDKRRAEALIKLAENRLKFAKEIKFANFKLENAYEAVIEAVEAWMALEGYKSYSHVADLAFLEFKGFDRTILSKLENLRILRHKSKYYGEKISEMLAEESVKLAEIVISRIKEILSEVLKQF